MVNEARTYKGELGTRAEQPCREVSQRTLVAIGAPKVVKAEVV